MSQGHSIDPEELEIQAAFKKLDKDGDGKISRQEWQAAKEAAEAARAQQGAAGAPENGGGGVLPGGQAPADLGPHKQDPWWYDPNEGTGVARPQDDIMSDDLSPREHYDDPDGWRYPVMGVKVGVDVK